MKNLTKITANGVEFKINNPIQVNWGESSNMNDFKTPGVYDIYGERTRQDDNLPILNASLGHSIAARLTVVASTLQPANNEICVTQFLMLSNRKGGDGNMYVRTYNENNSPAADWWTPWQKLQGIREGYIFTDEDQVNPDGGVQTLVGTTGLYNMIDNGIYSGIYTDDYTFQAPTFIETFTLIVINNYAVAGKDERLKRTISQLKYAVDAITNQASVKQRTKTDGDTAWSDWKNIGGGGSNEIELNVSTILNASSAGYKINNLISQGLIKENITYVLNVPNSYWHAIQTFFSSKSLRSYFEGEGTANSESELKIIYRKHLDYPILWIEGYNTSGCYYIISIKNPHEDTEVIKVSSPMTVLD